MKFFCLGDLDDLDDDDLEFELQFQEELSNGSLIFTVINNNLKKEDCWTSYVVVSPSGTAVIINDYFHPSTSAMLKKTATDFFNASR